MITSLLVIEPSGMAQESFAVTELQLLNEVCVDKGPEMDLL